jgi:glycine dehydrogenase subunit 1
LRYIPNSPEERKEMLQAIGLESAEELFDSIPQDLLLKQPLNTPAALSEIELLNSWADEIPEPDARASWAAVLIRITFRP